MRASTNIALFIVFLHAVTGFGAATGVYADWGVKVETGAAEDIEQANKAWESVQSEALGASTLIGVFLTVYNTLSAAFALVFALPTILTTLGVPGPITALIEAPLVFVVGRDLLGAFSGREI